VISGRKSAAKFWSEQKAGDPDKEVRDSNERHVHFICILEEVLEILKSREVTRQAGPSKSPAERKLSDGDKNPKLENSFALLGVEEPSKQFLEWQESQIPVVTPVRSKKAVVKSVTTYEQQIDEEEVSFAVYCFLWDFDAIRKWLQKLWLLYKQGYTDLASVSTLTNTAFDMFQRAEAELLACVCVVSELESESQLSASSVIGISPETWLTLLDILLTIEKSLATCSTIACTV